MPLLPFLAALTTLGATGCYTQLRTERYAVPTAAGGPAAVPPAWRRLQQRVLQAELAGPRAAWLATPSDLYCCPSAADLTACDVVRRGGGVAALAADGLGGGYSAVVANATAVSVASCDGGCACTWRAAAIPPGVALGRVNAVAGDGLVGYVASSTGLWKLTASADAEPRLEAVAGVPPRTEYVAVAATDCGAQPSNRSFCVAASTLGTVSNGGCGWSTGCSAGQLWMQRSSGQWRREWTRGFFGANLTATALAFDGRGSLWAGGEQALHQIDASTGVFQRIGGKEGLPANGIRSVAAASGSAEVPAPLWLATHAGAAARMGDGGWRWLAGPRWLGTLNASTAVSHVSADSASALITTADGAVARITVDTCYSLAAKTREIQSQWPRFRWQNLTR